MIKSSFSPCRSSSILLNISAKESSPISELITEGNLTLWDKVIKFLS